MTREKKVYRKLAEKLLVFLLLATMVAAVVWWRHDEANTINNKTKNVIAESKKISAQTTSNKAGSFNKQLYSLNDPASIWAIVNKGRELPSNYVPANLIAPSINHSEATQSDNMHLRVEAASALEKLVDGAARDSIELTLISGYRSYETQGSVYNGYVKAQGANSADTFSARAGHSEHQTGLAADLGASSGNCKLDKCFGDTLEGKWLAANSSKYGFIIRYQKDKQSLTGYDYEPWHFRYVGPELAMQVNVKGQTLEEFFGLSFYNNYPSTSYKLVGGQ